MSTKPFTNWIVVIPARLGSSRLPDKPLQDLCGKPLIVRAAENLAPLIKSGCQVIVATDSPEIKQACESHKITVEMTASDHKSGTDRCWEIASRHDQPYYLNVQGDEPFVNTQDLTKLMQALSEQKDWDLATMVHHCQDLQKFADPNVVKAVISQKRAVYFTRAMAPHNRNQPEDPSFHQHIGVYAYRKDALQKFCALPESPLEALEKLEQLRALEAGMTIGVVPSSHSPLGIDTPSDLEAARARFR